MKHAVIQGASRGIGLGMVKALLEQGDTTVHATCRQPEAAEALRVVKNTQNMPLHIHRLDVTDETSIAAAASQIRKLSPEIDLMVNTSGILHQEGHKPERRLEDLSMPQLLSIFAINAVGPLMVIKHLLPCFQHEGRTIVASLSARVGSIGDNHRGGWYGYRSSKAALNQMHKSLAIELSRRARKTISVVLHPGSVETDLTLPFRKSIPPENLFSVERSVQLLLEAMNGLKPEDHGQFFDYAKKPIEW